MITTHFNMFDVAVIGIMLLSCLFAFFRGFVREILSLGAWIGAGIVTLYYFPVAAAKLEPHFKNPTIAGGVGALGLYIGALMLFSMLNIFILKFMKSGSDVGMLDNALGLIFGVLRGAFIVSLGFFLIMLVLPDEKKYPDWLKESITRPYAEKGAIFLAEVSPEYVKDLSSIEKKMEAQAEGRADVESHENVPAPVTSPDTIQPPPPSQELPNAPTQ